MASTKRRTPADAHEWVSFDDPDEERTWLFDVTFLTSSWTCIYGCGCQGVLTERAPEMEQGCCSYGAHFTGTRDARRVEREARRLPAEYWQFADVGRRRGVVRRLPGGGLGTRMVGGACIFLNRPGFPAGSGCALHLAAAAARRDHTELKPDVCWQLPLRREDRKEEDGRVTSVVRQWDRRHWGGGGEDFAWWCTEEPAAFEGSQPVYISMRRELELMVGVPVYRMLVGYLESRSPVEHRPAPEGASETPSAPTVTPLAHPTIRR